MNKKKILWVSDSPLLTTGFGRNTLKVCEELVKRGHIVEVLGLQYVGRPIEMNGFKLLPNTSGGFDSKLLQAYIQSFNPDYLITVLDIWNTGFAIDASRKTGVPYINYFPLDGEPIPTSFAELASYSTMSLVTSKYSQRVLADAGVFSTVWCNGYDPSVLHFTQQEEKEKLKKEIGVNGFLISSVSRNISRKQVPLVIAAFKKFEDMGNKKDVTLLLNMKPSEKAGWDLEHIIKYFRVRNPVRFPANSLSPIIGVDEEAVAKFMMASDIHALSTSGDGFGLPVLESMACGTPNVVTDCTAPHELLSDGRGVLIKPVGYIFGQYEYLRAVCDVNAMADAFEDLYQHPEKRASIAKKAYEWAKEFTWSRIVDDFEKIINDFENIQLEAISLQRLKTIEDYRKRIAEHVKKC